MLDELLDKCNALLVEKAITNYLSAEGIAYITHCIAFVTCSFKRTFKEKVYFTLVYFLCFL